MMYLIILVLIIEWIITSIQRRNRAKYHGWKAYKKDYETFIYSQNVNGTWEEIEIPRVYYRGTFYILFQSITEWKNYPLWAQDRNKIMKRVLISFHEGENQNEIDQIGSHLKP